MGWVGSKQPTWRGMKGTSMVPWLALTHFWGGGVKTASSQLHTRSLKNTQPLLSRGTAQRSHSALADIITASPWRGGGQWVLPGLWDVTCIPADFKHDQRVHVRAGHLWTPPASEERAGNARGQGLKERGPCSLDCPSWRFHGYFLETDQTQGRQQGADHTATGRRIQGH